MARHALLIGVNQCDKFTDLMPLDHAHRDAKRVNSFFIACGYNTILLSGADASYFSIKASLTGILAIIKPGDTLAFYYSGHSYQSLEHQHLLLIDSVPPTDREYNPEKTISISEIFQETSFPGVKRIFVADVRFKCMPSDKKPSRYKFEAEHLSRIAEPYRKMNVKSVSRALKQSNLNSPLNFICPECPTYETDELKGGIFTHALLGNLSQYREGIKNIIPFLDICEPLSISIIKLITPPYELKCGIGEAVIGKSNGIVIHMGDVLGRKEYPSLSHEQIIAKSEADQLIGELLRGHERWLSDRSAENEKKRLFWPKLQQVFEVYVRFQIDFPHFEQCDMGHSFLENCSFPPNTLFSKSDFGESRFCEAIFSNVSFIQCHLDNVVFSKSELTSCNFKESKLDGVSLYKTKMLHCCFDRTWATYSHLGRTNFTHSTFRRAYLSHTSFTNSILQHVDFSNADLKHATFTGAKLSGATLTGASLYEISRADWDIEGVKCDYVYWDRNRRDRFPPENNFVDDGFETQYRSYKTFSYTLKEGITPVDLYLATCITDQINKADLGFTIKIDNASVRGLDPRLNFIMESGEDHRETAKNIFKNTMEHENEVLRLELRCSKTLSEERNRRADLAEEQLSLLKKEISKSSFQQYMEAFFERLNNEQTANAQFIKNLLAQTRNVTDFEPSDLSDFQYVVMYSLGNLEEHLPRDEYHLFHTALYETLGNECFIMKESDLRSVPDEAYIQSVYRNFTSPHNKPYVAMATLSSTENMRSLWKPVYQDIDFTDADSSARFYRCLTQTLNKITSLLVTIPLDQFPLPNVSSKEKGSYYPHVHRIKSLLYEQKKIDSPTSETLPPIKALAENTLKRIFAGNSSLKATMGAIAEDLGTTLEEITATAYIPKNGKLREVREKLKFPRAAMAQHLGFSDESFMILLEESELIPANVLHFVFNRYSNIINENEFRLMDLVETVLPE